MADTLNFSLVSPERELFSGEVNQVDAPGVEGEFGVLPKHAPFMTVLKPGVVRIHEASGVTPVFVRGGFADVTPAGLTILAEEAVRLSDVDETPKAQKAVQERLGAGFGVRSWQDLNRPLFSAMKLERTVMFIILTLIILVSSFTIISNLLLLTIEKGREIGILQALGASPQQIAKIFLFNGLMIGGSGVSLGLVMGVVISLALKHFPIIQLPADVYYIDRIDLTSFYIAAKAQISNEDTLETMIATFDGWKAFPVPIDPSNPYGD